MGVWSNDAPARTKERASLKSLTDVQLANKLTQLTSSAQETSICTPTSADTR